MPRAHKKAKKQEYGLQPLFWSIRRSVKMFVRLFVVLGFIATVGAILHYDLTAKFWHGSQQSFYQMMARAGFVVKEFTITGRDRFDHDELMKIVAIEQGQNILTVDLLSIQNNLEQIPLVKSAVVRRHLPSGIHISLTEREPFAVWHDDGEQHVIAMDGVVLPLGQDTFGDVSPVHLYGAEIDDNLRNFISGLQSFPLIRQEIKAMHWMYGHRWRLIFQNGMRVELPSDYTIVALERLRRLITQEQLIERAVSNVDLRQPDRIILVPDPKAEKYINRPNFTRSNRKQGV